MKVHDKIYINGAWVASTGRGQIDVINAATEAVIGSTPDGTAEDVDKAVAAARTAFATWSLTTATERAAYLDKIAAALGERADEIARTITAEVGMPLKLSTRHPGRPAGDDHQELMRRWHASTISKSRSATRSWCASRSASSAASRRGTTRCTRSCGKVAPALAAGCTVVLKPSEVAPLTAFILAEIIDAVGLPAGVFNLVAGYGPGRRRGDRRRTRASTWCRSPARRAPASGWRSWRRETVKRVALELGGKSANVILDDADLAKAVTAGVERLLPELRPGLHRADAHAGAAGALRRGRGARQGGGRALHGRRSRSSDTTQARSAGVGDPARPRARLHPQGHRGGRDAGHRRRRGARRPRRRATSCGRPCSPTCATT